ncbi:MAG: hypothetical protein NVS9B11_18270 [Candidatus Dormibacteraceae bacterium]
MTCDPGTGRFYCGRAPYGSLTVCRCECTCVDQRHCPAERTVEEGEDMGPNGWGPDECPHCSSLLCPPGICYVYHPRRHPIALTPPETVDDPDWRGGRPVTEAMA